MAALEAAVRAIEKPGLLWGLSKLVPIGYGIKKLQMSVVVEDDLVSLDELQEEIQEIEDYIQVRLSLPLLAAQARALTRFRPAFSRRTSPPWPSSNRLETPPLISQGCNLEEVPPCCQKQLEPIIPTASREGDS